MKLWEEIYSDIQNMLVILINIRKLVATSSVKQMILCCLIYLKLKELLRISTLVPAASKWTWLHKAIIHGSNLTKSHQKDWVKRHHKDWVKLDLVDI